MFSRAGLPGPPSTDLETATVYFIGARARSRGCWTPTAARRRRGGLHRVGVGVGWQQELAAYGRLLATETFADVVAWCEANPETAYADGRIPYVEVVMNDTW